MLRKMSAVTAVLVLCMAPVMAQDGGSQGQAPGQQPAQPQIELKDGELQTFVSVLQEIQQIQSSASSGMQESLENQGLSQQRFQEIHRSKQGQGQGQGQSGSGDISAAEEQKYQKVLSELQKIQQNMRSEIRKAVEDSELSPQRFNNIYRAVQTRPELQKRVQNMLSG